MTLVVELWTPDRASALDRDKNWELTGATDGGGAPLQLHRTQDGRAAASIECPNRTAYILATSESSSATDAVSSAADTIADAWACAGHDK